MGAEHLDRRATALPWLALVAVYVLWGSTYAAISLAVETIPPFTMAGVRFVMAGALLYPLARRTTDRAPTAREWWAAVLIGLLLIVGGNGLVSWAELTVPSGITALLVGTVPLWLVVLDRVAGGVRVTGAVVAGLVLGFGGVAVLAGPVDGEAPHALGTLAVLAASLSWAAGSLYSRTAAVPIGPLLVTAMSMLAGGAVLVAVGGAAGEWAELDMGALSGRSLLGFLWLVVFGSLVAFSAYTYVLRALPTSTVSTYAYVNPVVAVAIGAALLDEDVTARTLTGGAVVVAGVALIVGAKSRPVTA